MLILSSRNYNNSNNKKTKPIIQNQTHKNKIKTSRNISLLFYLDSSWWPVKMFLLKPRVANYTRKTLTNIECNTPLIVDKWKRELVKSLTWKRFRVKNENAPVLDMLRWKQIPMSHEPLKTSYEFPDNTNGNLTDNNKSRNHLIVSAGNKKTTLGGTEKTRRTGMCGGPVLASSCLQLLQI